MVQENTPSLVDSEVLDNHLYNEFFVANQFLVSKINQIIKELTAETENDHSEELNHFYAKLQSKLLQSLQLKNQSD